MLTGFGSLETAMMAQHRGICDYLMKPVRITDLKQSIRTALGKAEGKRTEAHLEGKLKQFMEYFSLVSEFTARLATSLDLREILFHTLERLKKIGESDQAGIILFPDVIKKLYYLKDGEVPDSASPSEGVGSLLAQCAGVLDGPTLLSVRGTGAERQGGCVGPLDPLLQAVRRRGLDQLFVMPLTIKSSAVGMAGVGSSGRSVFSELDIQLFTTLLNQASLALAKAFSFVEVEQRSREIALLHNLSLKLNQSLKVSDSIRAICEGASDITGASGALLQTSLEPGTIRNFVFNKNLGVHKEVKRSSQDWLIAAPARRTAFFSNDPATDDRLNPLEMSSLGMTSLAYVPLIYGWEDIGGLTVIHKESGLTFDQRDLDILHLYARHASEVLLNSQLFEAVKCSREKVIAERNRDALHASLSNSLAQDLEGSLSSISGCLHALSVENVQPSERREYLDIVRDSVGAMRSVIERFTNRQGAGQRKVAAPTEDRQGNGRDSARQCDRLRRR
jgi:GAF domain-containing protein